jgi:hypothetical protein
VSRLTSTMRLRRPVSLALAALLFAGLVGAASPAFAVRTLGLSSPSFDFNVAPGAGGTGDLFVINDGTEPLRVLVYFSNQKVDAKGQQTFQTPTRDSGDFLTSPASWCQVQLPKDTKSIGNVPFLDLKPKEKVPVKFTFDVPQGVASGDHQVFLFFEMIDATSSSSGVATTVQGRLGTHIRIRVQGAVNEALDVRPFTVRQFIIGDGLPWQFTVRNDGNIDEQVTSSISVLDTSEAELARSDAVTGTVVYAKTLLERSGNLSLKGAALGQFTVRLTTKYSDGSGASNATKTVVKDRTIWVVPLWLAIVLVAVVGMLALWLSWRAAVRSAERRLDRRDRRTAAVEAQRGATLRGRSGRTAPPEDYEDYGDEYEDADAGVGPVAPPSPPPTTGPRE